MKHTFLALVTGLVFLCSMQVAAQQVPPPPPPYPHLQPRVIAPKDRPTREQLATTFELMHLDTQMRSIKEVMGSAMQQQIRKLADEAGVSLSAGQRAALDDLTRKLFDRAMEIYPVEEMMDDVVPVYQRYLSSDDIDGLNAFYASPAGRHLLEAQPLMTAEYLPMVLQRLSERGKALEAELQQEIAQFQRQFARTDEEPRRDLVGWYKAGKPCIDIDVAADDTVMAVIREGEPCAMDEAHVARNYDGIQGEKFKYVFQAWTESGERTVRVCFGHARLPNGAIWYPNQVITMDTTPRTFELEHELSGTWDRFVLSLNSGGAAGTFHVRLIAIEPVG
jgi:hypothetical protein